MRAIKTNLIRFLLLTSVLLSSCASSSAVREAQKKPATKYDPGTSKNDLTEDRRLKWIPCGQSRTTQPPEILNGNRLAVSTASQKQVSLCQILQQSRKSVAVFQIAGLFCDSCQKEAAWVNQQDISSFDHHLILTEARNELDASGLDYFKKIAPRSSFFHDYDKTTANELNYGKSFGTVLVLHKSGEYRLYLEPGLQSTWYNEARQLANKPAATGPIGTEDRTALPYAPLNGADEQSRRSYNKPNESLGNFGFSY